MLVRVSDPFAFDKIYIKFTGYTWMGIDSGIQIVYNEITDPLVGKEDNG